MTSTCSGVIGWRNAKLPGVQRDGAIAQVERRVAERRRAAVLRIADDRVAARRRLDANLVRAAGFQLDLQPRPPSPSANARGSAAPHASPRGDRRRRPRPGPCRGACGGSRSTCPRRASTRAFDERPVRLADGAILELRRQPLRGAHVPGEHDGAGHRPIEPMRQAEVDVRVVGLAFAAAVELLDADFEAVDSGRRLREQPGGLVDDQHGAVVVENVERRLVHVPAYAEPGCSLVRSHRDTRPSSGSTTSASR